MNFSDGRNVNCFEVEMSMKNRKTGVAIDGSKLSNQLFNGKKSCLT